MFTFTFSGKRDIWGDYIIRAYLNGRRYREADYHTNNLHDALQTLAEMRGRANTQTIPAYSVMDCETA